ncbi:hypothetical protein MTO96_051003, partial [Rhipicephalus appendiculatus]
VWRHSDEFPHVSPELLIELLDSDELNVRNEADLLRAIDRWYSSATDEDASALPQLLQCVRIGRCSVSDLEEIRQRCPDLVRTEAYQRAVVVAYHAVALMDARIYVVGGWSTGDTFLRSLDSFDTVTGIWEHCSPMHVTRAFVCAAVLGEHLYAIGGHTGHMRTSSVERYSPQQNQWIMVSPMRRRRSAAAACVFRGKLYVSGGHSGEAVLTSVEEYTAELDSWVLVAPLPSARSNHRMVTHGACIYIIGGYNGRRRLNEGRSSFTVVDFRGEIYVIGGVTNRGLTAEVQHYSSVSDTWRSVVAPLAQPLGAMDACVVVGLAVTRRLSGR